MKIIFQINKNIKRGSVARLCPATDFFKSFKVLCVSTDSSLCEDWNQYKEEKCMKIWTK